MAGKWRHKTLRSIEIWVNGAKLECDAHGNLSGEITADALLALKRSAEFETVAGTPGDDAGGAPASTEAAPEAEAPAAEAEAPAEAAEEEAPPVTKKKAAKKKSSKKKK